MKTMTTNKTMIAGIFFLIFVLSCTTQNPLSGQVTTETRNVANFTSVTLAFSADVYLTQGESLSVHIEADRDIIGVIETIVRGNELIIRKDNYTQRNTGDVIVRITMPVIEGLSVTGSGDITAETPINAENIRLNISGSGSVNIDELVAASIQSVITGSGSINISGPGKQSLLDVTITGSGDLKADQLNVGKAEVNITGSGSARINVEDELDALITGSGNVEYLGSPLINSRSTGSGRTTSVN